MDTRTRIRRIIEIVAVAGASLACAMGAHFAKMVADAAPVVTGQLRLKSMPMLTSSVLQWKDRLPGVGIFLAAAIVLATVVTFVMSKNEDTRLQTVLVIVAIGYAAALQLWVTVGVGLVLIPHLAGGI